MRNLILPAGEPNLSLAQKLHWANGILTMTVLGLVMLMRQTEKIPLPEGVSLSYLPGIYSTLNAVAAGLLILALVMIKRGQVTAHKTAINAAMICSIVFLLLYVAYHFTTPETKFGGTGSIRILYFILLVSHIILAAVSLPFILLTWTYATTNQFAKHRRIAKIVFPVWLYVAISGPICYLMLRPYY